MAARLAKTMRLTCHHKDDVAFFDLESSFMVASGWSACWAGWMARADSLSLLLGTDFVNAALTEKKQFAKFMNLCNFNSISWGYLIDKLSHGYLFHMYYVKL